MLRNDLAAQILSPVIWTSLTEAAAMYGAGTAVALAYKLVYAPGEWTVWTAARDLIAAGGESERAARRSLWMRTGDTFEALASKFR